MRRYALALGFLSISHFANAQNDGPVTFRGYVETYYAYSFIKPPSREIPLLYHYHRHNEFGVNTALFQLTSDTGRVRAKLGLHAGTYIAKNYSSEPSLFQHIYDANAGVKLGKNTWLDAGIFGSSHIGFEGIFAQDNWTLTRSLSAENTPYYETGVKLTHDKEKLSVSVLALNGWQSIVEMNDNKAVGTQAVYKHSEKLKLNSSTFIGREKENRLRLFHDFFFIWQATEKVGITGQLDVGAEEDTAHSGQYLIWWNPTLLIRYASKGKWATTFRAEYYSDADGVIAGQVMPSGEIKGVEILSSSINIDRLISDNCMARIEGRVMKAADAVFPGNNGLQELNATITLSLAVSF